MRPKIRATATNSPPVYASEQTNAAKEQLKRCLNSHVVDIKPTWHGSEKHRASYGSSAVAAIESSVGRCDPPLEVSKLALEKGKCYVLVGPNGSGKSTLLDAIMDRRAASFDIGSHGYGKSVHAKATLRVSRLDQEELLGEIKDLQAREVLEMATAYFISQFPVDWLDPDAHEQNLVNQEAEVRIQRLMSEVVDLFEAANFLNRKVSELSGGERTKLSLMMVLASEPDVLLLDEPTNHLDLESIAKLTGLFDTYKRAGVSVVNVSHVDWFLDMAGEHTIELSADERERGAMQSSSAFKTFKKKERRRAAIKNSIKWQKLPAKTIVGTLSETNAAISLPDSPLKDVEVPSIHGGDITIFSGKNGTGKTKLMNELANPRSRVINRSEKGIQTAYLPQLWPEEVVLGTVQSFFRWVKDQSNPFSQVSPSQLQKELRRLGFGSGRQNLLAEPFANLSGGEQRLLWFVAASIIEGTDALVLDEPSNHMDEPTMMKVVEAIRSFPGAVVLSTHDLRLMEALEKDPGGARQGTGVTNVVFNRKGDQVTIRSQKGSPLAHAQKTIKQSRRLGGRVKV